MSQMDVWGNLGCYLDEDNVITFQVGTDPGRGLVRDMDSDTPVSYTHLTLPTIA